MKKYKWSAENNAFFPVGMLDDYIVAGWDLSDLRDISDDIYREFGTQYPEGKQRGAIGGMPAWVDAPSPSKEELKSQLISKVDALMAVATSRIGPLQDAVDLDDATNDEIVLLKKWRQYRVALNRIDASNMIDIVLPLPPST
ncbi:tail fiber assembly protein p37 [Yersinia intermedia]|uniref:tail fiber assembly protein n=1 Tax=Yersinia intermedia TaxID=631 RepID=UPI0005E166E4|nr:tail assembly chaperone [Yersinia intermedia]CNH65412.1 tail fiber assembly protein p37 [Yersinia intermedia]